MLAVACSGGNASTDLGEVGKSSEELRTTPEQGASCEDTAAWVVANRGRLPTGYEAVVRHSLPYRRAIFTASSTQVKSALWTQHVRAYVAAHPELSAAQAAVIERLLSLVSNPASFEQNDEAALATLGEDLKAVLGEEEAGNLVATLGRGEPTGPSAVSRPTCHCSTVSTWNCNHGCGAGGCNVTGGCGTFWQYPCNGRCG